MKSVIIFFNAITIFKSDISPLKNPEARTILLINSNTYGQLKESYRNFFEEIHVIDPMTFETTLPFVMQYLEEVKREKLRLVTNDECCIPIVGRLIDHLDLIGDGEKTLIKFIDKIVMKNTLDAQGIRTPYHWLFNKEDYFKNKTQYTDDLEKKFKYPFVLKPISLYGGAGFKKVHHRLEWLIYAEQIADSQYQFQIEEFIEGDLFHCDALIQNKQIIFSAISEYIWPMEFLKTAIQREVCYCLLRIRVGIN
jgi:hypothetical protein